MANVGFNADYSDDEQYHSAGDNSPTTSRVQQLWTFDQEIGQGGFGVVKLFVHKVEHF